MKGTILFYFLLLLCASPFKTANPIKPSVNYVSADPSNVYRSGSLAGGNTLYIRGSDLISDVLNIKVLIGNNECAINVDLTSISQIACTIPPSSQAEKVFISVSIQNVKATCPNSICYYVYSVEYTPYIQFLVPSALLPSSPLSFGAYLARASDLVISLDEFPFSSFTLGSFFGSCTLMELSAGFYSFRLKSKVLGQAMKISSAQIVPDSNYNPFDVQVVPDISSLSANTGPVAGINLTITGRGFADDIGKNKVLYEGYPCEVVASSYTSIQCNLINTPIPTQNISRPGHAGIWQRKFSLSGINNITQLKMNSAFQSGSNTAGLAKLMAFEIPYTESGSTYAEALEGLFKAPVTGSYQFLLSAQGPAELYISTTPLNKTNLTKIAEITTGSNFRDFFNPLENQQISSPVYLVADNYYYIQALHIMKTINHLTVGVRIPNTQRNFFSPREVVSIKIKADVERLEGILSINQTTETLQLLKPKTDNFSPDVKSRDFKYPPNSDTVSSALLDLGIEAKVLSQTFFDSKNQVTTQSQATRVEYRIKLYVTQDFEKMPTLSNPSLGNCVKAPNSSPTALVKGTYVLSLKGKEIPLKFDSTAEELQNAFNNALKVFYFTRVFRYGRSEEGFEYIIYFNEIDDIPQITVKSNSLVGGRSAPTVEIKVLQDASSNDIVLVPIPSMFLRTLESNPQITVISNDVLASCSGTCRYQPTVPAPGLPTIISFNLSQGNLEVMMANCSTKTLQDFTEVKFAGVVLNATSFDKTTQKLICSLPLNDDSSLRIVAGVHIPSIYIKQVGFAQVATQLTGLRILPTVKTIKANGETKGFLEFVVEGTAYGFQLEEPGRFGTEASVGGVECKLTYLTNMLLKCRADISVTQGPFKLSVNNITIETPFTFQKASITKQINNDCYLDIIGKNFTEQTIVKLVNEPQTVIERCRSCLRNSTLIRCSICDLPPGNYKALVTDFTSIDSASQSEVPFQIVFNLSSVEPKFGSQLGGTILTLKGFGFSETLNKNQVSISTKNGVRNVRCNVLEVKSTELKCITNPNTAGLEGPQGVYAIIGLKFDATCENNCSFTFSNEHTPMVYAASSQVIKAGDNITLSGYLFKNTAQVRFGSLLADIINVTSDKMVVRIPEVIADTSITLSVTDSTLGNYYVDPSLVFSSPLSVTKITPSSGSIAGTYVKISGTGFSPDAKAYVSGLPCKVMKVTSSEIVCQTPSNIAYGNTYIIQDYTDGQYTQYCSGCTHFSTSSSTPSITSFNTSISGGSVQVKLVGTLLNFGTPVTLTATSPGLSQEAIISNSSATSITASFSNLIPGSYRLDLRAGDYIAKYQGNSSLFKFNVSVEISSNDPSITVVSHAGGANLTLNFDGNPLPQNTSLINIKLAGSECQVSSVTTTSVTCTIPPLIIPKAKYLGKEKYLNGKFMTSVVNIDPFSAFDGTIATFWTGSTFNEHWIGMDLGEELLAEITQIQVFPGIGIDPSGLQGGVLEGSLDGIVYTVFQTLTDTIHSNVWNTFIFQNDPKPLYRFIRFRQTYSPFTCAIAEIRIKGFELSLSFDTDIMQVPLVFASINGFEIRDIPVNIEYRKDITPILSGISPKSESSAGGTVVTLTGEKFTNTIKDIEVYIDKTSCQVTAANSTTITCITGALPNTNQRSNSLTGKIDINIKGQGAAITTGVNFLYAERWSEVKTWGCDGLPIEGDSVHVPIGMNLIVDISPPKLGAVVVEGSLIFEDKDIDFGCEYLIIRNGVLKIGTEQERIKSKITITFYGDKNDEQLPIYGNKVFAVYEGTIDIHGAERVVLDTFLAVTANPGDSQITVESIGDFKVGDEIVISSTTNQPTQNEKRRIIAINNNKLTLDSSLTYTYLAENETLQFNNSAPKVVQIKAIVGLLSRNIIIQGDERSKGLKYGAHILFYDPGTENTVIRISYTEIRNVGQGGFSERHPLNFVNGMNLFKSYVVGCSIHSSYFRGIQVKNTNYLRIQKNILYDIEGEGIILPTGLERYNTIEENTVIHIKRNMFQYNSNPSSIKISNPLNYIRKNKVAGSISKGFDLTFTSSLVSNPSTCPTGERLGAFEDNYVISGGGSALYMEYYYPKVLSCRGAFYTMNGFKVPNLPLQVVFTNFTAIRTPTGSFAYGLSGVTFDRAQYIDITYESFTIYYTDELLNFTEIKNSIFVGRLNLKPGSPSLSTYSGIYFYYPRGISISNVSFAHFGANFLSMVGNDFCTVFTKDLKFLDSSKISLNLCTLRDLDGSLTNLTGGGSVVLNHPHLREIPECVPTTLMTNALLCNSSVEVRGVAFNEYSWGRSVRVGVLKKDMVVNGSAITFFGNGQIPLVTGYTYQIFLSSMSDMNNFDVQTSPFHNKFDLPIALAFNHTEPRETWDVFRGNSTYLSKVNNLTQRFDVFERSALSRKSFGDYYPDNQTKIFYLAVTGNDIGQPIYISEVTKVRIIAYKCRYYCPPPTPTTPTTPAPSLEGNYTYRLWSDASGWPDKKVPSEGSNVLIPLYDVVFLDVDTAALNSLEIQGELIFNDTRSSTTLTAKKIWVRGRLTVGTNSSPYLNKAIIRLIGTKKDAPLVVNSAVEAGTKVLVVTGELSLVGKEQPIMARLAENVATGSSEIKIAGNISNFNIGDQIVIAPSGEKEYEYETRTISQINLTSNTLTLNTSLQYFHYGNAVPYRAPNGVEIDMRAEVLYLSRNIRVEGSKEDDLGGRILVTYEVNRSVTKTGIITMKYVLLNNCGRIQTEKAGLAFELASNPLSGNQSVVFGSVFQDSIGHAVKFQQTVRVVFERNIIFKAEHYGVKIEKYNQDIKILNNVVLGVRQNSSASNSLLFYSAGIVLFDETSSNTQIYNNTVVGCSVYSFLIPVPYCTSLNFFKQNIAHSSWIGLLAYSGQKSCAGIADFTAYKTQYGVVTSNSMNDLQISNLVLTDNLISLNLASSIVNNGYKVTVQNSFFAAFTLQDCPNCYSRSTECSNRVAIGLNNFNGAFSSLSLSSGSLVLGSSLNLKFSFFRNFQENLLPQCTGNKIFSLNGDSAGFIPYTTVASSVFSSVNKSSLAYFRSITPNNVSCGLFSSCTLLLNVLVKDIDGSFTKNNKSSTLLPNNPGVIDPSSCEFNSDMNGYICNNSKYALVGFQVLDPDKSSLVISPVEISNSKGFNNKVYSYGTAPVNGDNQKFISIIQTNTSYNISFPKEMPMKIKFEMQGEKNDYALIKLQYNTRKVIAVTNTALGSSANSKKALPDGINEIRPQDPCGSYIFDRQKGTVEFKITPETNCQLLIEQTNSIVANIRFDITVEEFFAQGGVAPFIDKLASVLNIAPERIRVVEIYKGSTGIIFAIDAEAQGQDSKVAAEEQLKIVTADLQKAVDTGALSLYGAPVLSLSQTTVLAEEGQETINVVESDSGFPFVIVLVIVIPITVILTIVYFVVKHSKARRLKKYTPKTLTPKQKEIV